MIHIGLLVLRLAVGLTVTAHGAQKLFGFAQGPGISGFGGHLETKGLRPGTFYAVGGGVAEFLGGLCIALGVLTPVACCAVVAMMASAIGLMHVRRGFFNANGGYEFPLVLACSALSIAIIGPGAVSVDAALGIDLPEPGTVIFAVLIAVIAVAVTLVAAEERTQGVHFPGDPVPHR